MQTLGQSFRCLYTLLTEDWDVCDEEEESMDVDVQVGGEALFLELQPNNDFSMSLKGQNTLWACCT